MLYGLSATVPVLKQVAKALPYHAREVLSGCSFGDVAVSQTCFYCACYRPVAHPQVTEIHNLSKA